MWEGVRPGRREAAGDRGANSVRGGGLDCRLGAGRREERTWKMLFIFVTLEVSKLSGWLNADAYCREVKGGHVRCGAVCAPGGGGGGGRPWCKQRAGDLGLDYRLGAGIRGGAHVEHEAHACDARRVEAQRLVERRRVLPRVEKRACDEGRGAAREARGGRQRATAAQAACGGGRDCRLGAGLGEELTLNMERMVVTLEVSKLSGWLNADAP